MRLTEFLNEEELKKDGFGLVGKRMRIKYRSGGGVGKVTGIAQQGKTLETTKFYFMPDKEYRHEGEELPVTRMGDKFYPIDSK